MKFSSIIGILIFLPFIAILPSCEEVITDMELPYTEKLVIQAVLQAGMPVMDVAITKTLPPLEEWTIEKARITDADAKIICDGVDYKLVYTKDTLNPELHSRYTAPGLIIESGKMYKLIVKWNGKTATAETTVPTAIIIDSIYHKVYKSGSYGDYGNWNIYIYAVFKPHTNNVYIGGEINEFYQFFSDIIYKSTDTLKNGKLNLMIYNYQTNDTNRTGKSNFFINSYDEPFYDYYQTRYAGDMSDVIFGMGGKNIKGNVEGDGIGLFIGMAATSFKY